MTLRSTARKLSTPTTLLFGEKWRFENKLEWNFLTVCPLSFTYAHQHFGMLFSDDKLLMGKHKPVYFEISKMLSMSKEVKSQLKSRLKNIYKYSEFFSNVILQMNEAQKYPYSLQSLSAIVAARKVVKVDPAWNPKFTKRVPCSYSDIEELVNKLYDKYLRVNKKAEYKTEQKENKIMTIQLDVHQRTTFDNEDTSSRCMNEFMTKNLTRDTVSSSRKKINSFVVNTKKDYMRRNKSKGSFNAKQLQANASKESTLLSNIKNKLSQLKEKSKIFHLNLDKFGTNSGGFNNISSSFIALKQDGNNGFNCAESMAHASFREVSGRHTTRISHVKYKSSINNDLYKSKLQTKKSIDANSRNQRQNSTSTRDANNEQRNKKKLKKRTLFIQTTRHINGNKNPSLNRKINPSSALNGDDNFKANFNTTKAVKRNKSIRERYQNANMQSRNFSGLRSEDDLVKPLAVKLEKNSRNEKLNMKSTYDNSSGVGSVNKPLHKHSKSFLKLDLAYKIDNANQSIFTLADLRRRREERKSKLHIPVPKDSFIEENRTNIRTSKAVERRSFGGMDFGSDLATITNKYRQRKAQLGFSINA
jgi:hypothetical protein